MQVARGLYQYFGARTKRDEPSCKSYLTCVSHEPPNYFLLQKIKMKPDIKILVYIPIYKVYSFEHVRPFLHTRILTGDLKYLSLLQLARTQFY